MIVPVTILVTDRTLPSGVPLDAVIVRFYSEDGVSFITEGSTSTGVLVLDLPEGSYWVRFFKVGFKFDTRMRITVDAALNNSFSVRGLDLTQRTPSTVPELCRVSGYVVNVAGAPAEGATFMFEATDLPKVVGSRAIVSSKVCVRSQKEGYVEVDLVRGGAYDVTVTGSEDTDIRIKVPDADSVDITDLLWPYVVAVSFDPPALALAVEESVLVAVTVLLSSGVSTPYTMDGDDIFKFGKYATIRTGDEGVVSLAYDEGTDSLLVVGASTGTTTITPTLAHDAQAKRLPTPVTILNTLAVSVA